MVVGCSKFEKNRHKFGLQTTTLGAKKKYRGMFETHKSGNKTSSGEIGLNIRTLASPNAGQDQVSRGVSVLCWHAAPVANVLWKPHTTRIMTKSVCKFGGAMFIFLPK